MLKSGGGDIKWLEEGKGKEKFKKDLTLVIPSNKTLSQRPRRHIINATTC